MINLYLCLDLEPANPLNYCCGRWKQNKTFLSWRVIINYNHASRHKNDFIYLSLCNKCSTYIFFSTPYNLWWKWKINWISFPLMLPHSNVACNQISIFWPPLHSSRSCLYCVSSLLFFLTYLSAYIRVGSNPICEFRFIDL